MRLQPLATVVGQTGKKNRSGLQPFVRLADYLGLCPRLVLTAPLALCGPFVILPGVHAGWRELDSLALLLDQFCFDRASREIDLADQS